MFISIVIPTYNRLPILEKCLIALESQKESKFFDDFEVMKYDGIIEPGMTLCDESYIGSESGREGVKLEEQVLVSHSGVERLSSYPFQLDIL